MPEVTIRVPEEVQRQLNRTPEELARDLRLYASLMMFRLGKLSAGAAAALAGIPKVMFLDICAEYGIPVSQISAEDLENEVANLEALLDL